MSSPSAADPAPPEEPCSCDSPPPAGFPACPACSAATPLSIRARGASLGAAALAESAAGSRQRSGSGASGSSVPSSPAPAVMSPSPLMRSVLAPCSPAAGSVASPAPIVLASLEAPQAAPRLEASPVSPQSPRSPVDGKGPSLVTVLGNARLLKSFEEYVAGEYAAENLMFLRVAEAFACAGQQQRASSAVRGDRELRHEAKWIFDQYIDEESPHQINISAALRKLLREFVVHESKPVSTAMFEQTAAEIRKLLDQNFLPGWQATGEWRGISYEDIPLDPPTLAVVLKQPRLRKQFEWFLELEKATAPLRLLTDVTEFAKEAPTLSLLGLGARGLDKAREIVSRHRAVLAQLPAEVREELDGKLKPDDALFDAHVFAQTQLQTQRLIEKQYYSRWLGLRTWEAVRPDRVGGPTVISPRSKGDARGLLGFYRKDAERDKDKDKDKDKEREDKDREKDERKRKEKEERQREKDARDKEKKEKKDRKDSDPRDPAVSSPPLNRTERSSSTGFSWRRHKREPSCSDVQDLASSGASSSLGALMISAPASESSEPSDKQAVASPEMERFTYGDLVVDIPADEAALVGFPTCSSPPTSSSSSPAPLTPPRRDKKALQKLLNFSTLRGKH
eukprot:m51a1_g14285 hypothetical protein (623) ;mRNA; r:388974-391593